MMRSTRKLSAFSLSLAAEKGDQFGDEQRSRSQTNRPGENIYCPQTKKLSGTNVDDIAQLIKHYPIRIVGRKGDVAGPMRLQEEIKRTRLT
jgi:hypothetical protein